MSWPFFQLVPDPDDAPDDDPDDLAACEAEEEAALRLAARLAIAINAYGEEYPDTTYSHILHALAILSGRFAQDAAEADADA
jgi:hypothetical protein